MSNVTDNGRKGLSNLRTATTSHLHAKPPQKGTEYLNLYLLDREAQRLEKELSNLEKRQKRIQARLTENRKAMGKLEQEAQQENLSGASLPEPAARGNPPAQDHRQRQWKKLAVDY